MRTNWMVALRAKVYSRENIYNVYLDKLRQMHTQNFEKKILRWKEVRLNKQWKYASLLDYIRLKKLANNISLRNYLIFPSHSSFSSF